MVAFERVVAIAFIILSTALSIRLTSMYGENKALQELVDATREESFSVRTQYSIARQDLIIISQIINKRRSIERDAFLAMVQISDLLQEGKQNEAVKQYTALFSKLLVEGFGTWPTRELPELSYRVETLGTMYAR